MKTRFKALVFALLALSGLLFAAPALAQTYTVPGYSSYSQYSQPQYVQPQYGACPTLTYNLTSGSSDYYTQGQVSMLQRFLANRYGDSRLTGGYYGSLTVSYVARFQQEQGVYPISGGVGPLTRQAIQRVCGGVTPTPTPVPNPQPSTTFRLDRNFSLSQGQAARLSNGTLDITLNQIVTSSYSYNSYYYGSQPAVGARITLGLGCVSGTYCFYYPSQSYTLEEGDEVTFQGYTIELVSFTSSKATFRVEDTDDRNTTTNDASIDVTAPKSGASADQGDTLRISWNTDEAPSNSSVILDLYTQSGGKIGTIAISSDLDGSYSWRVPTRGTFCTQQYPNGLCGYDLDGRYYVKASLVRGNGFDSGATFDSDTSGTFTISRDDYDEGYCNSNPPYYNYCTL